MARYYAVMGETVLSLAYMDSTTAANHRQNETFNALKILRAKQELFEVERVQKEIQVDKLRRLSLEAIAFDAGFPSRTTFYRVFKAQTKINPATYRQNRGK